MSEPPPIPSSQASHLTHQIDAVVLKALAKSPDDRYQTAGELAAALRTAVYGESQLAFSTSGLTDIVPGPPAPESMTIPTTPQAETAPSKKWLVRGGVAAIAVGGLLTLVVLVLAGVALARNLFPGAPTSAPTQIAAMGSPTVLVTPAPSKEGEQPASSPPTATATQTATVPASTATPVPPTATPTATATPVPPTATPTATPEPSAQRMGRVRFVTGAARLDTAHLELTGLDAPPTGKHYEAWLVNDAGGLTSIGIFAPDGNGSVVFDYTDPEGRNLAAIYSGFLASLEPDFGDAPTISQEVVLEGALSDDVIPFVREAVLRSSDVPLHSLIVGLETEALLARDHMGFSRGELVNGNLQGGLNHMEHVVNILVGQADERFGDKNGDGATQNPGDGFGLLGYLGTLQRKATAAAQADPTSAELALHVGFLEGLIRTASLRTDGIVALMERSYAQDTAQSALALLDQALGIHDELLDGLDANGNEVVEPIEGEGGIELLAQHTGYLANIEVYRAVKR